jgi:hypothetical protein
MINGAHRFVRASFTRHRHTRIRKYDRRWKNRDGYKYTKSNVSHTTQREPLLRFLSISNQISFFFLFSVSVSIWKCGNQLTEERLLFRLHLGLDEDQRGRNFRAALSTRPAHNVKRSKNLARILISIFLKRLAEAKTRNELLIP